MVPMTQQNQIGVRVYVPTRNNGIPSWAARTLSNDMCNLANQNFTVFRRRFPDEMATTFRKGTRCTCLPPKNLSCAGIDGHGHSIHSRYRAAELYRNFITAL